MASSSATTSVPKRRVNSPSRSERCRAGTQPSMTKAWVVTDESGSASNSSTRSRSALRPASNSPRCAPARCSSRSRTASSSAGMRSRRESINGAASASEPPPKDAGTGISWRRTSPMMRSTRAATRAVTKISTANSPEESGWLRSSNSSPSTARSASSSRVSTPAVLATEHHVVRRRVGPAALVQQQRAERVEEGPVLEDQRPFLLQVGEPFAQARPPRAPAGGPTVPSGPRRGASERHPAARGRDRRSLPVRPASPPPRRGSDAGADARPPACLRA